jgi:hypothetical protein
MVENCKVKSHVEFRPAMSINKKMKNKRSLDKPRSSKSETILAALANPSSVYELNINQSRRYNRNIRKEQMPSKLFCWIFMLSRAFREKKTSLLMIPDRASVSAARRVALPRLPQDGAAVRAPEVY